MMRRSRQEPSEEQDFARSQVARPATAAWSSQEWRADAVSWLDEQLTAAGIHRRGDV